MKMPKLIVLQVGEKSDPQAQHRKTPVEAVVLAEEIVAVVPRRPESTVYNMPNAKAVVVLRNRQLIECVEEHQGIIHRWVEAIMPEKEAPKISFEPVR